MKTFKEFILETGGSPRDPFKAPIGPNPPPGPPPDFDREKYGLPKKKPPVKEA